MIRAGIVIAKLQINNVLICDSSRFNSLPITEANGAKLNQQTKVRKKANQVKCNVRYGFSNESNPFSIRL
jgi:uncharacterized membrane protein YqiK